MLLGYTTSLSADKCTPKLAIIPIVADTFSPPVPIESLFETRNAVFYIGPKEAVVAERIDNALILYPVLPAIAYLTPDTNERPGIQAAKIKLEPTEAGTFHVYYSRERAGKWLVWDPIAEQRM